MFVVVFKQIMPILDRLKSSAAFCNFLKLFDIFTNAFFFTVVTIFFWVSTSDVIYAFVFPDEPFYLYLTAFLMANVILLPTYIFQDELQQIHNYLAKKGCHQCGVTDAAIIAPLSISHNQPQQHSPRKCYYDLAFFYRCLYSYVVSVGYVAQWISYWEIFSYILADVDYTYFLVFSFVAMLAYRIVLNSTMEYYCLCVPFCLVRDTAFDSYCLQWHEIDLKNVRTQN